MRSGGSAGTMEIIITMNKPKKKGTIWMIGGLLLLAAALLLTLYNIYDGIRADQAAQRVLLQLEDQMEPLDDPTMDISDILDQSIYADREMPTIEIDGNRYIGTLEIPTLELTLPIMEEWDYDKLKVSPCRYSGSFYRDDLVIAGHNYARHFSPLKWLPEGSEINFTDVEGNVYHYTIGWVDTLNPDQVEDLLSEGEEHEWDLTLFTCTTGGKSRHTIRCIRTPSEP